MKKEIMKNALADTPDLFSYIIRRVKDVMELKDLLEVIEELQYKTLEDETFGAMLFVSVGKVFERTELEKIPADLIEPLTRVLQHIKYNASNKEIIEDCIREMNSGILLSMIHHEWTKESVKESGLVKQYVLMRPFLEKRVIEKLGLNEKKEKTIEELKEKNIERNELENLLRKSEEENLYEWILEKYKKGLIKNSVLSEMGLTVRLRLYIKSKGEINCIEDLFYLEKENFENLLSEGWTRNPYFPYEDKESLEKGIKETVHSWHKSYLKQLYLEKELATIGFMDFEDKTDEIEHIIGFYLNPIKEIKNMNVVEGERKIERFEIINESYYKELEEQYGVTLKEVVSYYTDMKPEHQTNTFWVSMFTSAEKYRDWMFKLAFIKYTKATDKKKYESLFEDTEMSLIRYLKTSKIEKIDEEEDFYVDQMIYQLKNNKLNPTMIDLFVAPKMAIEMNFYVGHADYNGLQLDVRKIKSFMGRLKMTDKKVTEKLKNIALRNIEEVQVIEFKRLWFLLKNGLLNEKQQAELLFAAYPKEMKNICLLNDIDVKDYEEFKETLKTFSKTEVKKVFFL